MEEGRRISQWSPYQEHSRANVKARSGELIRKKGKKDEYRGPLPPNPDAWRGCRRYFYNAGLQEGEGPMDLTSPTPQPHSVRASHFRRYRK